LPATRAYHWTSRHLGEEVLRRRHGGDAHKEGRVITAMLRISYKVGLGEQPPFVFDDLRFKNNP
jgi:hypothetical protein